MADLEQGLKWWIRYVIVPLIAGSGMIAIISLFVNWSSQNQAQNVDVAPIVRGPQYNEVQRTGSAESNNPRKLVSPTRAEASAQRVHTEPLKSVISSSQPEVFANLPISNSATADDPQHSAVGSPQPAVSRPDSFDNLNYRLSAGTLRKAGDEIKLDVVVETHDQSPMRFYIHSCYLLDENGVRWDLPPGWTDTAHFMQDVAQLIPGTRLRSEFRFVAKGDPTGAKFTFTCTEFAPRSNRTIVIPGLQAQ